MTGGRDYRDQRRVDEALDAIHAAQPIERLGHGHCTDREGKLCGADKLAHDWARRRGIQVHPYPAEWDKIDHPLARIRVNGRGKPYDAGAGPRRNLKMLIEECPQLLVVFPGDRGTADCRSKALLRSIAVMDVDA